MSQRLLITLMAAGLVLAVTAVLIRMARDEGPPPPDAIGAVLVGAGDIAECGTEGDEATASLLDEVVEQHPDAVVFTTGDNAYPDGSYDEYVECYGPSWGRHKSRTRPAVGNHEFKQTKAEGYNRYWRAAGGEFDLYYYSYDVAEWHIVVLNSECHRVGCEFNSEDGDQVEWLEADLAASDAACTIAIWHHPRWSSGRYSNDADYDTFWEVLHDHGVEIVLNGHDHLYERFEPMNPDGELDTEAGITQFTVGTGGGNLRGFEDLKPHSAARASEHGVLKLTLHSGEYAWDFLPVEGGNFTDSGTATCHGPDA
jgi:hypothetical protein